MKLVPSSSIRVKTGGLSEPMEGRKTRRAARQDQDLGDINHQCQEPNSFVAAVHDSLKEPSSVRGMRDERRINLFENKRKKNSHGSSGKAKLLLNLVSQTQIPCLGMHRVWYRERKLHDFECIEFGMQMQTPCLGMHRVWYRKRKLHDFECTEFGIANANSMSWNAQSLVSQTQTP
ncbi:hypothetical protein IFM89_005041 [Coptis chinensis]|uniref:Uncharacterized protein n=1 Tax=Coptis chinensis TaxID=261450 RepID=A0A835LPM6_9MAGN|nr:hypothetical protein IFM89_005041 [Coptis chinensis]